MSLSYQRSTPLVNKKTEDTKVLREKQLGSTPASLINSNISNKLAVHQQKKAQLEAARNALKKPGVRTYTSENKTSTTKVTAKAAFRSTPISKGLLAKSGKIINQNDKLSTPVNRNIRSVFGSSARQEGSASKENSAKKRAPIVNSYRAANSTPLNRNNFNVSNSSAKARQSPCFQNPIINGKDYSAIMARKKELGYAGAGYVVEYDCSDEDLRNIHVTKGLWKITTGATPNKNSMAFKMGAPQFATRLDVETSAPVTTPGKSVFHNIDFNWNVTTKTNGILKHDNHVSRQLNLGEEYLNNSTAQSLDLETSLNQKNLPKKSIRWAEILEEKCGLDKIEEKYRSPASIISRNSPYQLTPKHNKQINVNLLTGSLNNKHSSSGKKEEPTKRLRRSLSMNDINDIIIDEDDSGKNESLVNDSIDNKMQLMYSPALQTELNPKQQNSNLNETFELLTPSKALLENKTGVIDQEKNQENKMKDIDVSNSIIDNTNNKIDQLGNESNNSLNDLMIPFSLADAEKSHDEKFDEETVESKVETKVDISYKKQDLIDKLEVISTGLRAGLFSLKLNEEESKLVVDTTEYIKISNVINDIEKSLMIYKNKLAFN